MTTEYWLKKDDDEEYLAHTVVTRFISRRIAIWVCWLLNKYNVEKEPFYVRRVRIGEWEG